jgi:hypothetical protein
MRMTRLHHIALPMVAAGSIGCADHAAPTQPDDPRQSPDVLAVAPIAALTSRDPTSIPIGSPALVDFRGRTQAVHRTVLFSQSVPTLDVDRLHQAARNWLAEQRQAPHAAADAATSQWIDHLLTAGTPEEIRAALGAARERVVAAHSVQQAGVDLFVHTAAFLVDGREALRIVTRAGLRERPLFDCVDDARWVGDGDDGCSGSDPNFNPEPVAADLAAMQYSIDIAAADLAALESSSGASGRCDADRGAYYAALIAFSWKASETLVYAWRRDVLKTYAGLRDSSALLATTIVLMRRYKECLAESANADPDRSLGVPLF